MTVLFWLASVVVILLIMVRRPSWETALLVTLATVLILMVGWWHFTR